MTPFAQLEKKAYYSSRPFNPYATQGAYGGQPGYQPVGPAQPPASGGEEGWGWGDTAELGADLAAGTNPFTGVPWFGGKAIKEFSDGNWGQGLMNLGFGALSFLPGGGSLASGLVKGVGKLGSKLTPKFLKTMQTGGRLGPTARKALGWGGAGAAGTGIGLQVFGGGAAGAPRPPLPQFQFNGAPMPKDLIGQMADTWRAADRDAANR